MPTSAMASIASSASTASSSSQSLLSRLSLPSPQSSPPAMSGGKPSRKRRASNDEDEEEQRRRRMRIEPSTCPWMNSDHTVKNGASRDAVINDELLQFIDYIGPSDKERKARQLLVSSIESILRRRWGDVHVLIFGSNATGLELTGGDIDLVVSFDSTPYFSDPARKSRLASMGDLIRKSGISKWINRIFGARVPIITFATTEELGELSVDISIRNDEDSGARAIPLIKQYLEDMPALRRLIMAVKAFLSLRDLNDASQNTLSSYAITLLCISFLQRNPARRPKHMLANPIKSKSFGTLLMDFFRHYGHDFSYATHYVSVSGKDIFTKRSKSWDLKPGSPAVLAVQCILNSENNITKGCSKIALIVDAFKEALHVLQNTPINKDSDERSSVLCGIFSISEEDIARREALEASVDSGAYARATEACIASSATLSFANNGSSGGVFLGPRGLGGGGQHRQNQRNGQMRAGGPTMGRSQQPMSMSGFATTQQPKMRPILRWESDRSRFNQQQQQQQTNMQTPSNPQFNFTFSQHPQRYHDMSAHFFNATAGPILTPMMGQEYGTHQQYQRLVSNNHLSSQRAGGRRRDGNGYR